MKASSALTGLSSSPFACIHRVKFSHLAASCVPNGTLSVCHSGASSVAPGASTIEIELEPTDDGTLLHFTHSGFADIDETQKHAHGWDHYLPRLEIAASGGDPGRDTWLDGMT